MSSLRDLTKNLFNKGVQKVNPIIQYLDRDKSKAGFQFTTPQFRQSVSTTLNSSAQGYRNAGNYISNQFNQGGAGQRRSNFTQSITRPDFNNYFKPSPNGVRTRDILREIPKTILGVPQGFIGEFQGANPNTARFATQNKMTGNEPKTGLDRYGPVYQPTTSSQKIGSMGAKLIEDLLIGQNTGINQSFEQGINTLRAIPQVSRVVGTATDILSKPIKIPDSVIQKIKPLKITFADVRDVTAGRGTAEQLEKFRKFAALKDKGFNPRDIIKAGEKENPLTDIADFVSNTIAKSKSRLPKQAQILTFVDDATNQSREMILSKPEASAWTAYLQSQGIKYELRPVGYDAGFAKITKTPKPPTDLATEAKKYGSAEEFVKDVGDKPYVSGIPQKWYYKKNGVPTEVPEDVANMLNKTNYNPMKQSKLTKTSNNLYHTTPATNLESIAKEGLVTGKPARFEGVSSPNKISFSANEKGASYYGGPNDVMIRTKTGYDPGDLDIDLLAGGEGTYRTGKNIPPDKLEVKIKGKWQPLTDIYNQAKGTTIKGATPETKVTPFGYLQAKKGSDGKFGIFWRGTNDNADINGNQITTRFNSASEARRNFEAEWYKSQEKSLSVLQTQPKEQLLKETPQQISQNVNQDSLSQPNYTTKKYKIIKKEGIVEVDGKPVEIVNGLDTFIHKGTNGWVVSEKSSGQYMADGRTQKEAIAKAKQAVKDVGIDQVQQIIDSKQLNQAKGTTIKGATPEKVTNPILEKLGITEKQPAISQTPKTVSKLPSQKIVGAEVKTPETPTKSLLSEAKQKQSVVPESKSLDSIVSQQPLDVKNKVGILDYLRTPDRVLKKIGLEKESNALRQSYDAYLKELPKEIDKITEWSKEVPKESSQTIFKYLDGQKVELSPKEMVVAKKIKSYLSNWADRLKLPEDKRISNYITHIFEKDFIQKEFDPDLAKLLQDKVAGSVYDPFTQERLGKQGYVEDVWRALDAYVKRATRKVNMDPALEQVKQASKNLELSQFNYVKSYVDRINLRPTEVDNLVDNSIKQMFGYKFGQRPIASLSRTGRQMVYRGTLGLNPGSALKNLSQGANTYAELGERYTIKGYTDLILKGTKELDEVGALGQDLIQDRVLSVNKQFLQKLDKGLFYMFEFAEKINRGSAYYGGKARALAGGATEQEAIQAGLKVVRDTQFTFGSIDTPVAMQSDMVKLLTQFQSFTIKQGEFLGEKIAKKDFAGLLRYIGASIVFIGTIGQVFGMDYKDMIPSIRIGLPPTLQAPTEIGKALLGSPDKYGNEPDTQQKLKNIGKSLIPFIPAGTQAKKTFTVKDVAAGKVTKADGKLKYKIKQTPENYIRAGLFGSYHLPEAQLYRAKQDQPKTKEGLKYLLSEESPAGLKKTVVNLESLGANPVETINLWIKGEPIKKMRLSGDNPVEQVKNFFGAITVSERADVSVLDNKDKSTQVDHIKSKWLGGREEISNYQILTNEEHAQKTKLDNALLKQYEAGDITKEEAWKQIQEFNKTLHPKPIAQKTLDKLAGNVVAKQPPEEKGIEAYKSGAGASVEERANWVKTQLDAFGGTKEEKQAFINDLYDEKVLTTGSRGTIAKLKELGIDVSRYTGTTKGKTSGKKAKKGAKITAKKVTLKAIKLKGFKPSKIKIAKPPKIKAYKPKKIALATPQTKKFKFSTIKPGKIVSGRGGTRLRAKR